MKRVDLIEIHDQPWCSRHIRDGVTDFLQYATGRWGYYAPALPIIRAALSRLGTDRVVDLCSGASGPWHAFSRTLSQTPGDPVRITLTDRFPNLAALRLARDGSGGLIDYREEPIDAARIPPDLTGLRTIFTAFHHFPPQTARDILQNAVDCRQGIGIFEMTDRSLSAIIAMITSPFLVMLATPRIRPFRLWRLIFTYLVPLIPLVVMLDGLASCLRTYTLPELAELTASLQGGEYVWEFQRVRPSGSPFPVLCALGAPRDLWMKGSEPPP